MKERTRLKETKKGTAHCTGTTERQAKMKRIMVNHPSRYWLSHILKTVSSVIQWTQATRGKAGELSGRKSWSEGISRVGQGGEVD